jgi:hypothetical protein
MTLNTFADVEHRYHATNQLRSDRGKRYDIRPLDSRERPWERIARIDDNCYVLTEGGYGADPLPAGWGGELRALHTAEDFPRYAPIVWRRQTDGTETVTISNVGWIYSTVHSRHRFLDRWLPNGIVLDKSGRDGKHHIVINVPTQERRYLPIRKGVPCAVYDHYTKNRYRYDRLARGVDGLTITAQRTGDGVWKILTNPHAEPHRRVDTAAKAEYAEDIKAFREWALAIAPVLPVDRIACRDAAEKLRTALPGSSYRIRTGEQREFMRGILRSDDGDMRICLLYHLMVRTDAIRRDVNTVDMDTFKRGFSRVLNRECGWNITVEG